MFVAILKYFVGDLRGICQRLPPCRSVTWD